MIEAELRAEVLSRAGGRCEQCGGPPGEQGLHVHHTSYPTVDTTANLEVLCPRCHGRETARHGGTRHVPRKRRQKVIILAASVSSEDETRIDALAEKWGSSRSAAIRRLIREAARREKVA